MAEVAGSNPARPIVASPKQYAANIWKYFLLNVSQRRHYIPILSVYFLTLPNSTARQIGLFTGIGYLAGFVLEIPSGYVADLFGHKAALILSKIFMLASLASFILGSTGHAFVWFILGSIFMSGGFAFMSGSTSAFMHNTLLVLRRDREYTKIMSKISANAALVSMVLVLLLPFTTKISILTPLWINLGFDAIGLCIALWMTAPPQEKDAAPKWSTFTSLFHKAKGTGFFPFSVFIGLIGGMLFAQSPFREVYLVSLGFPVILVGVIMGISRFFWFVLGHQAERIRTLLPLKRLLFLEILFFSFGYFLMALLNNPWVLVVVAIIYTGYYWGRREIMIHYSLDHFVHDHKYKATILSIQAQVQNLIQAVFVFGLAYFMGISYKTGYYAISIALFVSLVITYFFVYPHLKHSTWHRRKA